MSCCEVVVVYSTTFVDSSEYWTLTYPQSGGSDLNWNYLVSFTASTIWIPQGAVTGWSIDSELLGLQLRKLTAIGCGFIFYQAKPGVFKGW